MKSKLYAIIIMVSLIIPATMFGGESSAILGTEDFFAGALPPPGLHYINYLAYYSADEVMDGDGDKIPIDFEATAVAEVARGIYVSDITVLGANLGWHVVVPLVYRKVEIKDVPPSMAVDESRASIGDIYFSPFLLGWHSKLLHCVVGLDIIAPTGQYNEDYAVNIGSNHWTFEPAVAVSLIDPSGFSASAVFAFSSRWAASSASTTCVPPSTTTVECTF